MIVVTVTDCPPRLRGDLSKWLLEINTGVYVGTGRVEEIKAVAHMMGAEVIIFDNTLSPMQLRNLKDIIELSLIHI